MDEPAMLAQRLRIPLERIAAILEALPAEALDRPPFAGASSPAVIAGHVAGAARGWALGIGCALEVSRDRGEEFETAGVPAAVLAGALRSLASEVEEALATLERRRLDEEVLPPQAIWGLTEPATITRREALVAAIAHASEHLGELQITRDLAGRA